MKFLRRLLFPFSLLYALVVIIRNWFYDAGFFKSYKFKKPVISVGNLEVGGAGKSPMTEYLIRLLKNDYKLATLSRGYGRNTKGYLVAGAQELSLEPSLESRIKNQEPRNSVKQATHNTQQTTGNRQPATDNRQPTIASQIGDEPAQFYHKFPDITVAVCEKRVVGLNNLMPHHDLVILDDAYQHRAVEPGLSILLFDYNRIFEPRLMLPAGNYREPFSGRWRAQIIVITKCPENLSDQQQNELALRIKPESYQQLFFSAISYQPPIAFTSDAGNLSLDKATKVYLLTGIANADPLLNYLTAFGATIVHHKYPDHHPFTLKNITKLAGEFAADPSQKKTIITTEKDAQRLEESWFKFAVNGITDMPVFIIPISVKFLNNSGPEFNRLIIEYVRKHRA